jgi:hypothetical protein
MRRSGIALPLQSTRLVAAVAGIVRRRNVGSTQSHTKYE